MDESLFDKIFSAASGVWALVCMGAVALFKGWPHIMARVNERLRDKESEKNGDWARLRDEIKRLDERCDHLQHEVDDCRRREGEWMARAIKAEAASEGVGDARQAAQRIVSAERQVDAAKRDKGKN